MAKTSQDYPQVLPQSPRVFRADSDASSLANVVSLALRRDFAHKLKPIEHIAAGARSNYRTAENWWYGRSAPQGHFVLRLMRLSPTFKAEVRRLEALEAEHDPAFARELARMEQQFWRLPEAQRLQMVEDLERFNRRRDPEQE